MKAIGFVIGTMAAAALAGLGLVGPGCGPSGPRMAQPGTAAGGAGQAAATTGARTLDDFEQLTAWKAVAADGVRAEVQAAPGVRGQALRLAFDLTGTSGYAVARRDLPLDLSENFELSFQLRGEAPVNNLEIKLVDASGENVWWWNRRDFELAGPWRKIAIKKRQIEFAWGPTADKSLRQIAGIEIVVSTGKSGGKGFLEVDDLAIRALPTHAGPPPAPVATASAQLPEAAAALAVDGQLETAWRSGPRGADVTELALDLGRERDLGGVMLHWAKPWPTQYAVEASLDGETWQAAVGAWQRASGELAAHLMLDTAARFLRVRMTDSSQPGQGFALAEVELLSADEVKSGNDLVTALARRNPRGRFPRGFSGEQPYWTIVGVDGGASSGLLSEDGALELRPGGASVEPFVTVGDELFSWANVQAAQALEDGYLPIPKVTWQQKTWELEITALAAGDAKQAELAARYVMRNRGTTPLVAQLTLAVRPFQVNAPAQFLNIAGGIAPIGELDWAGDERLLSIDGAPAVRLLQHPSLVSLMTASSLTAVARVPMRAAAVRAGSEVNWTTLSDPRKLASAALAFELRIAPGQAAEVVIAAPLIGAPAKERAGRSGPAWFSEALAAMRQRWHEKLDRVALSVPPAGAPIVETLRSSLAYMLVSRDGAMLRPGTRSYARAWIRDGAMISEALLRLGHPAVAADFLRYYAPYQFASGKVPCCVDAHGAGPVPENDSHGQLMYLANLVYRYGKDRALAQAVWPNVLRAAKYQEELRQSERTARNQTPERRQLWGLMPPSISHEGYSARPAYSYWDDFWALRGVEDAAELAGELGDLASQGRLSAQRDEFTRELRASIEATAAAFGIDFIAGAADLGDFDATSTTIAVAPGVSPRALPPALLAATFERYWKEHSARKAGAKAWKDYTPYELRVPGTFVRMGQRERAEEALAFFFADRRPAAWNQWAEVVGRLPREPRFIGDMPHAWVHSDYARSALDLFAYERREERSMVLAAGIPTRWLDAPATRATPAAAGAPAGSTSRAGGISIGALPTPWGPLGYSLARTRAGLVLELRATAVPPGGFVLPWPYREGPGGEGPRPGRVVVSGLAKGAPAEARRARAPVWRTAPSLGNPAESIRELVITEPVTRVTIEVVAPRR